MSMLLTEIFLVGGSVILLFAYYGNLSRIARLHPESTAVGCHRLARAAWIQTTAGGVHELLAVQTLRNSIMSSTLLASTAILFAIGLLGVVSTTDKITALSDALNFLVVAIAVYGCLKFCC